MSDDQSTNNNSYVIPDEVKEKFPEIVKMLINSKSIDDEEKNYWFSALSTMDDEQISSLKEILDDEKEEINTIEQKEKNVIPNAVEISKSKTLEEERQRRREARRKAESESRTEEMQRQQDLISMLDTF